MVKITICITINAPCLLFVKGDDMSSDCKCGSTSKLIFSCSGAADVGAIADQAARKLTKDGVGKMFCLAGIGGRVSSIMQTTKSAQDIITIDGCPQNCAKKSLEEAGFNKFKHLELSSIGLAKGTSTINEQSINLVTQKSAELLQK